MRAGRRRGHFPQRSRLEGVHRLLDRRVLRKVDANVRRMRRQGGASSSVGAGLSPAVPPSSVRRHRGHSQRAGSGRSSRMVPPSILRALPWVPARATIRRERNRYPRFRHPCGSIHTGTSGKPYPPTAPAVDRRTSVYDGQVAAGDITSGRWGGKDAGRTGGSPIHGERSPASARPPLPRVRWPRHRNIPWLRR